MSETRTLKEMLEDLSDPILADWITDTAEAIIRRCAEAAYPYESGVTGIDTGRRMARAAILREAGLDEKKRDGDPE